MDNDVPEAPFLQWDRAIRFSAGEEQCGRFARRDVTEDIAGRLKLP
jgi:hypothetical protein